eukprot:COSAG01_NODE_59816_length_298_cov_0.738693_1_plen_72_part_01
MVRAAAPSGRRGPVSVEPIKPGIRLLIWGVRTQLRTRSAAIELASDGTTTIEPQSAGAGKRQGHSEDVVGRQ